MGTTYNTRIVTDGLLLHLDAANLKSWNRTGSLFYDVCGQPISGTIVSCSYSTSGGGSMAFNGTSSKVMFEPYSLNNGTSLTVCSWFNCADVNKYQDIFDTKDSTNGGIWLAIRYNSNNGKVFSGFDTIMGNAYLTASVSNNTWYNIVQTTDGTTHSLYLNGEFVSSRLKAAYTNITLSGARIGNVDADRSTEYFTGTITGVSIYNRCLSADEVKFNFNALRGRFGV